MSYGHLAGLTIATTAHNNVEMSHAMLKSFEDHLGTCESIVVVDDGSKEPYSPPSLRTPVQVVRNEKALGFCRASDIALRQVHTEFALLVDADVLFLPGDFRGGFEEFRQSSHWSWVNFLQIDFEGRPQQSFERKLSPAWLFVSGNQVAGLWKTLNDNHRLPESPQRIVGVEIAHSSCVLVRMSAYRSVGGFDPWYWQAESDVDLSLAFLRHGYGVGIDSGYTVKHEGAGGKTGGDQRTTDLYRARLHLYEKIDPLSRLYLRPLLFIRHLFELVYFALGSAASRRQASRLPLRWALLKTVLRGY